MIRSISSRTSPKKLLARSIFVAGILILLILWGVPTSREESPPPVPKAPQVITAVSISPQAPSPKSSLVPTPKPIPSPTTAPTAPAVRFDFALIRPFVEQTVREIIAAQGVRSQPSSLSVIEELGAQIASLQNTVTRSIPAPVNWNITTTSIGSSDANLTGQKLTVDNLQLDGNTVTTTSGDLSLGSTGGTVAISGNTTLNNVTYSWPSADGTSGQALTTDASGGLSWTTISGGGGGTALELRELENFADTSVSSISFEPGHFSLSASNSADVIVRLDWGSGGPASLSQAETVTGAWAFSNNTSISGNFEVGTDAFFVNSTSGNVGIGKATPITKLEVNGTASASAFALPSTTGALLGDCDAAGDTLNWDLSTMKFVCGTDASSAGSGVTSNSLDFDEFVNSMTLDANVTIASTSNNYTWDFLDTQISFGSGRILPNGNMGIGTTAPSSRFHVVSNGPAGDITSADFKVAYIESSDGLPLLNLKSHGGIGIGYNAGNNSQAADLVAIGWQAGSSLATAPVNGHNSIFIGPHSGQYTETGENNVYIGEHAGKYNITGSRNVAFGVLAGSGLASGSYTQSVFLGAYAGQNMVSGTDNIAIGYLALSTASISSNSIAIGTAAGGSVNGVTGEQNVSIGRSAGANMSSGTGNILVGYRAGSPITTGVANVFIGRDISVVGGGMTGTQNVVMGELSAYSLGSGNYNTILGARSGRFVTTGSSNIIIGRESANSPALSTGGSNILIGNSAQVPAVDTSNHLNIGALVYGNLSTKVVGINTVTPDATLDVKGNILASTSGNIDLILKSTSETGSNQGTFRIRSTGASERLDFLTQDTTVTAMTIASSGFVGIGTTTPATKLHVRDTTTASGAVLRLEDSNTTCDFTAEAGGPSCGSDRTLKKDIASLPSALDSVLSLRPVTYRWLTDSASSSVQAGFIAQEVEEIFPDLVTERMWIDGTTRKFLTMGNLMPYLVGGIQELVSQSYSVESALSARIAALESRMGGDQPPQPTQADLLSALTPDNVFVVTSIAEFKDKVKIAGQLTVGRDTAGRARIYGGRKSVKITFSEPYDNEPSVIATPLNFEGPYRITGVTTSGFEIHLSTPVVQDVTFNWHVLGMDPASVWESDSFDPAPTVPQSGGGETSTPEPTPSSDPVTPEPTPSESVAPTPTPSSEPVEPTPSPEPTPELTPSPAPVPEPTPSPVPDPAPAPAEPAVEIPATP